LQTLRELLNNAGAEPAIFVSRHDLEALVTMAERVGLAGDVSTLLERVDAVTNGYQERIGRLNKAIGELVARRMGAEDALRKLAKDEQIPAEVISAFTGIISILRNGVKSE
jgi:hypothetical protein